MSLDVALGAAVLSGTFNYYYNGYWSWNFVLSLGFAVWIIYTFDHLMDAHKSENEPTIERHRFHRKHNKLIIVMLLLASMAGFCSLFYLPKEIIFYGLILLMIVVLYFLIVMFNKKFYLKEFIVALVYSCGIFLGPLSILELPVSIEIMSHFIQILFLALLNLTLFSWIEYNLDLQDGHSSIATKLGKKNTDKLILSLLIGLFSCQILIFVVNGVTSFQSLLFMMSITLLIIYMKQRTLGSTHAYRWVGDVIFFIPVLQLLF